MILTRQVFQKGREALHEIMWLSVDQIFLEMHETECTEWISDYRGVKGQQLLIETDLNLAVWETHLVDFRFSVVTADSKIACLKHEGNRVAVIESYSDQFLSGTHRPVDVGGVRPESLDALCQECRGS